LLRLACHASGRSCVGACVRACLCACVLVSVRACLCACAAWVRANVAGMVCCSLMQGSTRPGSIAQLGTRCMNSQDCTSQGGTCVGRIRHCQTLTLALYCLCLCLFHDVLFVSVSSFDKSMFVSISVFLFLSASVSVSLCVCPSIFISVFLSLFLSFFLSFFLILSLSLSCAPFALVAIHSLDRAPCGWRGRRDPCSEPTVLRVGVLSGGLTTPRRPPPRRPRHRPVPRGRPRR
jgi:hypothetical protein